MTTPLNLHEEVASALRDGHPVVALESTILSHGLPPGRNLDVAHRLERVVRDGGAVPATIAVLDGRVAIGLSPAELERVCAPDAGLDKLSLRDLGPAVGLGRSGATTVASTSALAAAAGIGMFATGGLGGVHVGAAQSWDVSADLGVLAKVPTVVVCSGVKSVLDIPATLERLETLSVPVVGYRTTDFPSFWLSASGHTLDWSVDDAAEIARVMRGQDELGHGQGIVVANPIPTELQWDPAEHDRVLQTAFAAADAAGVTGKAVTPFLLGFIVEASGGKSLEVNLDIARNNVRLAAEIAIAWSALNASADD